MTDLRTALKGIHEELTSQLRSSEALHRRQHELGVRLMGMLDRCSSTLNKPCPDPIPQRARAAPRASRRRSLHTVVEGVDHVYCDLTSFHVPNVHKAISMVTDEKLRTPPGLPSIVNRPENLQRLSDKFNLAFAFVQRRRPAAKCVVADRDFVVPTDGYAGGVMFFMYEPGYSSIWAMGQQTGASIQTLVFIRPRDNAVISRFLTPAQQEHIYPTLS